MIVSIDIGTSYSSMCVMGPDGKAKPVDISTGASMYGSKYSLPSAVFVEDNGNVLVGQAAMNSRKRKPQNFCMEFKRNLGQNIPILLGNRSFFPEDLYTELFRHMKSCAEKASSQPIEKAYLTHQWEAPRKKVFGLRMPVPCRRCSVRHCCPRCSFHGFGRRFACIAIRGSCLTTMKPGNCFTCRCSRGSHCLLTASGCGSVLRNKSRAKDTCSPFLGARAYGAGL